MATLSGFLASFSVCFFYHGTKYVVTTAGVASHQVLTWVLEFLSRAFDIYTEMQTSKEGRIASPRANIRSER